MISKTWRCTISRCKSKAQFMWKSLQKKDAKLVVCLVQSVKAIEGVVAVGRSVEEEVMKANGEKILIIGKQASGMDQVGKAIRGTDDNEFNQKQPLLKKVRRSLQLNRTKAVEYFYIDDETSLFANDWSTQSVSEDNRLVYCFPVEHRFTTEDINLLKKYLPYQQRKTLTIAFTFSDGLSNQTEYIDNLPKELKGLLAECGNKHLFIKSDNKERSNEDRVKHLVEPISRPQYYKRILYMYINLYGLPFGKDFVLKHLI